MMSRIAGAALALIAATAAAPAAETVRWTCAQNDRHLVVQRDNPDGTGDLITVRRVAPDKAPPCSPQPLPGDYDANPKQDALYLIALKGDFLILTESTGPQGELLIVDIPARKPLLRTGFSTEDGCDPARFGCADFTIADGKVTFWRTTQENAAAKNCPSLKEIRKLDLTPTIERQTEFDFASRKLVDRAERRCVAYQ